MIFYELIAMMSVIVLLFLVSYAFVLKQYCTKLWAKVQYLERLVDRHQIALEMEEFLPLPWEAADDKETFDSYTADKNGNVIYINRTD